MILSITIPVLANDQEIERFIEYYRDLLKTYPLYVISTKDNKLRDYAAYFEISPMKFWEARKKMIGLVSTKYILTLDIDTFLPLVYINQALNILEQDDKVGVVAIDYERLQGHLAFGTAIWRTTCLDSFYNWNETQRNCECIYAWNHVRDRGFKIETLPLRAIHF